ncbi:MAG: hypothetical protein ACQEWD_11380 [Bacteroidota bacterium]
MSKKQVIHTDLTSYKRDRDKQTQLQSQLDIIFKEYSKAGIEVKDIRDVIKSDDPATFAREQYWQENRKFFPPGVDATTAINRTAYSEKVVQDAWSEYKKLSGLVKPLTIREDSIELTVKESEYNWYLNNDKKELYTALENFIKASEELNKHINVNPWNLQRAITGEGTMVTNGKLTVNPWPFKA